MSKRNLGRTIFYGVLTVLSAAVIRSLFFTVLFALLTVCNAFLTKKSRENEKKYSEKLKRVESLLEGELTEKEKRTLDRLRIESADEQQEELEEFIKSLDECSDEEEPEYE